MFTGLITKIGVLAEFQPKQNGASLRITHDPWELRVSEGESMAIQGVCVTVTSCNKKGFTCDLLAETLKLTNLGSKRIGSEINLERALRLCDLLGGHIVSGHVDGTGLLEERRQRGREWTLRIRCSEELARGITMKGAIACDGVSLTVTSISAFSFEVNIAPFTWEHTTLNALETGDTVNLETDMLGKYVRKYVESRNGGSFLGIGDLKAAGFV